MDMDFESKRKALLRNLSSQKRETMIKRKEASIKMKTMQSFESRELSENVHAKPAVAVYGAQSFFMRSFLQSIQNLCSVQFFEKNETLIESCLNEEFSAVILDMDEPTDWRLSTDIFTTIRTVLPGQKFAICTKSLHNTSVETLLARGAIAFLKPVTINTLMDYIKKGLIPCSGH